MSEARAELPEGWEWVTLGDVCKQDRQIIEGDSKTALTRPFLGMEHVESQTGKILIDLSNIEGTEAKGTTFAFSTQHVLYGKLRPYLNKVVMPNFEGRCSTELIPLMPKGVSRAFLAWLLRSPQIIEAAMLTTTGSRMPRANLNDLMKTPVPLPPLESQTQIAETLEKQTAEVDKARAAAEAQLEAVDDLAVAHIRRSLEAELQAVKLRDGLKEVAKGVGKSWEDYPLIGATISGVSAAKTGIGKQPERYKLVDPETIFYNPMRINIGSIGMIDEGDEAGITSPDYVVLKTVEGVIHHRWLYYWLRSPYGANFIDYAARGAVRIRLLFKRLSIETIEVPSWEEQVKAAEALARLPALKNLLFEQLEAINALPAKLLSQAFSGELTRQPSPEDLRAALTCLAVERLHYRVFFGVVQLMKVLYFAQVHHGVPLGYTIRRHTYGPFDKAVYDLEKEGERQGWFSVDKAVDKQGSRYVPGAELDGLAREAEGTLSRWKGELSGLLDLAETFDTRGLELLATLYAVWNDFLIEGHKPTDREITDEVERWPDKAGKFQPGEKRVHLQYLREYGLVPQGTGQSTRLTYAA